MFIEAHNSQDMEATYMPLTDQWVKMWCYIMECYSAIKKNKIRSFVVMWMDLESVIQSKVSQKEKNKYHILIHTYIYVCV